MSQHTKEKLWSEYKYEVMWHSQKHYNQIREELKAQLTEDDLKSLIDEALAIEPLKGSMLNTFDHMWGYFKKEATDTEKEQHQKLKENFQSDKATQTDLLQFICTLAEKYQSKYLLDSSILKKA